MKIILHPVLAVWLASSVLVAADAGNGGDKSSPLKPPVPQAVLTQPDVTGSLRGPALQLLVSGKGDMLAVLHHDGVDLRTAATEDEIGFASGNSGELKMSFSNDDSSVSMFNDHGGLGRWRVSTQLRYKMMGLTDLPGVVNQPGIVAFDANGTRLAVAGTRTLSVYNAMARALAWKHEYSETGPGPDRLVAMSPEGQRIAVTLGDGTVQLFEGDKGTPLPAVGSFAVPVQALALSPNGTMLAVGLGDGGVELLDSATGKVRQAWAYPAPDKGQALQFSPDGHWLAAATATGALDEDFRIGIFNTATGDLTWEIRDTPSEDATPGTVAMAFAPDGKTFYTAGAKLETWTLK